MRCGTIAWHDEADNFWADLIQRIERHNYTNVKGLEDAVRKERAATDKKLCQRPVTSMPDRIARFIEYTGAPTSY